MASLPKTEMTEDAIIRQLVRLLALCDEAGLDLDLMLNSARFIYDGDVEVGT